MEMKILTNFSNRSKGVVIFGITVSTFGVILLFEKIWIMELLTSSLLVLKPNSLIDSVWRKIPDIHTDIYFFNWINPEDFHNSSIKAKFEQIGPYKFKQDIEKMDVIWNNNNSVTYSQLRHFYFDEKRTNAHLSERMTTVNIIALSLSHRIRHLSYLLKKLVSVYLATSTSYINMTLTIKQFLFDGIDNFVLDIGNYFPFIFPEIPRVEKFSLISFIKDYKAFEGIMNIKNGADGLFDIRSWNFNNVTPYFNASCAKIHGSAGELYSQNPFKSYIGIFVSAICRHLRLDFEEEVMVNGILGYKYAVANGILDNGTLIPGNECYCGGDCIPSGMLNISSCRYGFPVFLSLPNFYGADPVYLDAVEGLHPTKDKHEAYIVVEPTTGILLKAIGRVQLNARIYSIADISMFENVRELFVPVMWMEQTATLPDNVYLLLKIFLIFPHLLTGIASIFIILGFILMYISCKCKSTSKNLRKQQHIPSLPKEDIPLGLSDPLLGINNTPLSSENKNNLP